MNASHAVQAYVRRSVPPITGCGSLPIKRIGFPHCWQRCSADPVTDVSSICFMTPRYGTREKRQFCSFATNVCVAMCLWSDQSFCLGLVFGPFWPFGTLSAFGCLSAVYHVGLVGTLSAFDCLHSDCHVSTI